MKLSKTAFDQDHIDVMNPRNFGWYLQWFLATNYSDREHLSN